MSLNKDAMRKGSAAIQESVDKAASGGTGTFKPFLPSIYWKSDGDAEYLLFLNDLESIPKLLINNFVPDPDQDGRFTQTIARTEPMIGERYDPMEEEWNFAPKDTNLTVAVRLEPITEIVKGRERPRGFEVATVTFNRKIRDEAGELTEEIEEVTAPAVGIISQSPHNFGKLLTSFDENEAPIHECAVKVTRVGSGTDTAYSLQGYPDQDVDLTNLIEFVEGISFLGDRKEEVLDTISNLTPEEAALEIGAQLLDIYIDEIGDEDRYNRIFDKITEPAKYGKRDKKGSAQTRESVRPVRPSQRRAAKETVDVEEESESKVRSRPKKVDKNASQNDRMIALREKAAANRQPTAA